MANEVLIPKTFINNDPEHGIVGDIADATDFNANFQKCLDMNYVSPTAPPTPYVGQFWTKTDEPDTSPLKVRMRIGSKWMAIQLMEVES